MTTARFNHPNIVTIHAIGQHETSPYLALEFLEGESLGQRFATQKPDLDELIRIALAIASALKESHKHKILHRDLKPENVFVTKDEQIRVLDFGLAKQVLSSKDNPSPWLPQSEEKVPTQHGTDNITGTPLYLAPEVFMKAEISEASDVWALAILLYEGITGHHPLQHASSIRQLALQLMSEDPMPTLRDVEGVPPALANLVDACLSRAPEKRPSAAEIIETLESIVAERSLHFLRPVARGLSHQPSGEATVGTLDDKGDSTRISAQSFKVETSLSDSSSQDVFVGRGADISRLMDVFQQTKQGYVGVVQIVGVSGIGKTALAQQATRRFIEMEHAIVLTGRCDNQESLPYNAWARLIEELCTYLKSLGVAELSVLMPRYSSSLVRLFPVLREIGTFSEAPNPVSRAGPSHEPNEIRRRGFIALRQNSWQSKF